MTKKEIGEWGEVNASLPDGVLINVICLAKQEIPSARYDIRVESNTDKWLQGKEPNGEDPKTVDEWLTWELAEDEGEGISYMY